MKTLLFSLWVAACLCLAACAPPSQQHDFPMVNVPAEQRQANWRERGRGSCSHAAVVTALRWQGQAELADWWLANHGGGETYQSLSQQLTEAGITYKQTVDEDDVAFLEWAVENRYGALVACRHYTHMVYLVHLDGAYAGIVDSNFTDRVRWVPRQSFLDDWKNSHSWAIALLYEPAPPRT